jgi:hypothetical protein
MAPGSFERQMWPRVVTRGAILTPSGLATVHQQKGGAAAMPKSGRGA